MAAAGGNAVVDLDVAPVGDGLWPRAEIEGDVFPGVAGLCLEAKTGGGLVAAMHHAILAADILGDAIDDAVVVPFDLIEKFFVGGVVAISHEVAWAFPAADVAGGDGPGGAGEIALAGEELEI